MSFKSEFSRRTSREEICLVEHITGYADGSKTRPGCVIVTERSPRRTKFERKATEENLGETNFLCTVHRDTDGMVIGNWEGERSERDFTDPCAINPFKMLPCGYEFGATNQPAVTKDVETVTRYASPDEAVTRFHIDELYAAAKEQARTP